MEKASHLKIGATVTAFLLIGTFATAQTAPHARTSRTLKPRDASSGQASGIVQRKDGANVHSDYSRPVDQGKKGEMGGVDGGSNAAAHAARGSNAPSNASSNARTGENPLYEDRGKSGTNPLYESRDRLKAPAGASNSQSGSSYKDGEDMTTRTHPGNVKHGGAAAPKTAADASRKHIAGVKYQDRTAGHQANKRSSTENFKQDFGQVQANKR